MMLLFILTLLVVGRSARVGTLQCVHFSLPTSALFPSQDWSFSPPFCRFFAATAPTLRPIDPCLPTRAPQPPPRAQERNPGHHLDAGIKETKALFVEKLKEHIKGGAGELLQMFRGARCS